MGLTIALFFFSSVLLTIFIGICIWWRKYGKNLFKMVQNNQNLGKNIKNMPNIGDQMKFINDIMTKTLKNNPKNRFK